MKRPSFFIWLVAEMEAYSACYGKVFTFPLSFPVVNLSDNPARIAHGHAVVGY